MKIRARMRGTPSPTETPMAVLIPVAGPEETAAVVNGAIEDVSDEVVEDEVVVAVVDRSRVGVTAVDDADPTTVTLGTLSAG